MLPDGDADIDDYPMETIKIPGCTKCDCALKPDVVFFGDNVPRERVKTAILWLSFLQGSPRTEHVHNYANPALFESIFVHLHPTPGPMPPYAPHLTFLPRSSAQ